MLHGTGESSSTLHLNRGRCEVTRQHAQIFGTAEHLNTLSAFHLHSGRFELSVYGINWQDAPVIVVLARSVDILSLVLAPAIIVENVNVWRPDVIAQHLNSVSSLYYLFHARSCAAGTQCRYSGCSSGACASCSGYCRGSHSIEVVFEIGIYCSILVKHCPSEFANLLRILTRACFSSLQRIRRNSWFSLQRLRSKIIFEGAYLWFWYRSKRLLVPAPSNNHSGIFALEVFEDFFQGTPAPSRSREAVLHDGRTKLAQALQQYRVVLCNMYGYSCRKKVSKVIWKRAAMHQKVKFNADWCHSRARVSAPLTDPSKNRQHICSHIFIARTKIETEKP